MRARAGWLAGAGGLARPGGLDGAAAGAGLIRLALRARPGARCRWPGLPRRLGGRPRARRGLARPVRARRGLMGRGLMGRGRARLRLGGRRLMGRGLARSVRARRGLAGRRAGRARRATQR
jgi:hypothetical protein